MPTLGGMQAPQTERVCQKTHQLIFMTEPFPRYIQGNLLPGANLICSECRGRITTSVGYFRCLSEDCDDDYSLEESYDESVAMKHGFERKKQTSSVSGSKRRVPPSKRCISAVEQVKIEAELATPVLGKGGINRHSTSLNVNSNLQLKKYSMGLVVDEPSVLEILSNLNL